MSELTEAIQKGDYTLEKLQSGFFLTEAQEAKVAQALEATHD